LWRGTLKIARDVSRGIVFMPEVKINKADKLEILEILSALESWGFSTKQMFPDYLHERLSSVMDKLREEILSGVDNARK